MKRLLKIVAVVIVAIILFFSTLVGLQANNSNTNQHESHVCYYGCPNSKRIEKLNLKKSKRRLR